MAIIISWLISKLCTPPWLRYVSENSGNNNYQIVFFLVLSFSHVNFLSIFISLPLFLLSALSKHISIYSVFSLFLSTHYFFFLSLSILLSIPLFTVLISRYLSLRLHFLCLPLALSLFLILSLSNSPLLTLQPDTRTHTHNLTRVCIHEHRYK